MGLDKVSDDLHIVGQDTDGKVIAWPNGALLYVGPPHAELRAIPGCICMLTFNDETGKTTAFALNLEESKTLLAELRRLVGLAS